MGRYLFVRFLVPGTNQYTDWECKGKFNPYVWNSAYQMEEAVRSEYISLSPETHWVTLPN